MSWVQVILRSYSFAVCFSQSVLQESSINYHIMIFFYNDSSVYILCLLLCMENFMFTYSALCRHKAVCSAGKRVQSCCPLFTTGLKGQCQCQEKLTPMLQATEPCIYTRLWQARMRFFQLCNRKVYDEIVDAYDGDSSLNVKMEISP